MSTLHTVQLQCNTHVQISNDGGDLSSDAGMALMVEFLHKIKFDALLSLDYSPRYWGHEIASGRSESNVWSVANTD